MRKDCWDPATDKLTKYMVSPITTSINMYSINIEKVINIAGFDCMACVVYDKE